MKKAGKKIIAVLLTVLLAMCYLPMVSLATETGTLTVRSNVTADGVDIADDVAFSYEVTVNDALYNGHASGSDGNTYTVNNGVITLPYNVSATIQGLEAGSAYSVKRLAYDNENYALVDESASLSSKIAENICYKKVNDAEEVVISYDEFKEETNDGQTLNSRFIVMLTVMFTMQARSLKEAATQVPTIPHQVTIIMPQTLSKP